MAPVRAQHLEITSVPVTLTPDGARRIGGLTFLAGWQMTSPSRQFGGLSSLSINGQQVTAIADMGAVVRFHLGRFGHVSDASIAPLPQLCGDQGTKEDRDSESLALDPVTGRWWVGYEVHNLVCRISPDFLSGEAVRRPPEMRRWPTNGGPETMLRLADGRFVVIAETARDGGPSRPLVIFEGDPALSQTRAKVAFYQPPKGFSPTDAAQLPDGRLLILNRRFSLSSLFTAALVIVHPSDLSPGAVVRGRTLAVFEPPFITDNYEGVSVTVEDGKPIVWLVSDDNFMRWQRTLLLKFRLD